MLDLRQLQIHRVQNTSLGPSSPTMSMLANRMPIKMRLLSLPQKEPEVLVPVVLVAAVDLAEEEQGADDVGAPDVHHWPPPFQVHLPPCPDTSWASVTCWTTPSSSPGPSKGCSSPTVQFMAHRLFGCWGFQRITSEVLVVEKCVRASVDRFNWVSSEI